MEGKPICHHCNISLTYEYVEGLTESNERIWYPSYVCGICSFNYPIDGYPPEWKYK